VRVEPRFDVGEQAAVDLQAGSQAAHEAEDGGTVASARFGAGVDAQADVVVAPDAHGFDLPKEANRFLHPLAYLEHVAQDHEALGPVPLQHGDGPSQLLRLLVDAGQQPQLHRLPACYVARLVSRSSTRSAPHPPILRRYN
jgi:hypothetical protein